MVAGPLPRGLFGTAGQADGGTDSVCGHSHDRARRGGSGRPRRHQRHRWRHSGYHRNRGDRNRWHRPGKPHRHHRSSESSQVCGGRPTRSPRQHCGRVDQRRISRRRGARRSHERGEAAVAHRPTHRQRRHRWRGCRIGTENQCTCTQANTGEYRDTGSPEALQRKLRLLVSSPPDTQFSTAIEPYHSGVSNSERKLIRYRTDADQLR
jgi:hypothetical protein